MIVSAIDRYGLSGGGVGSTDVRTGYTHSPKFIFGIQHPLGTGDTVSSQSILPSFGFATADLSMRSIAFKIQRTTGTATGAQNIYTDSLFAAHDGATGSSAIDGKWELSAVGSDGITTRVIDQYAVGGFSPSTQILSLGGPAFAQVVLGTFTLQHPAATSVISSPGFTPDGVLMIASTGSITAGIGIGAAVRRGTTLAANSAMLRSPGIAQYARSYTRYGECIAAVDPFVSTPGIKTGTLTAWRSDGFEVTSSSDGNANVTVYFAAFRMAKGFDCRILTGNTATSLTTVNLTTSGQFGTKAGILVSHNKAQSAAGVTDSECDLSIGMYQVGLAQLNYAMHAIASSNSGDMAVSNTTNHVYNYINGVPNGTPSIKGQMAITALGVDSITGTMIIADPAPAALWSLAFGTVPAPKGGPLIF